MNVFSLEIANQATINIMVGLCFALLNELARLLIRGMPRIVSVLAYRNWRRALLIAYVVALVLQLITSPYFRAYTTPTTVELAWSPFQALFNVIGVLLVDLVVLLIQGARRGAEAGRKGFDNARTRAADMIDDFQLPGSTPEERAATQQTAAETEAERKQRLDDRLGKY